MIITKNYAPIDKAHGVEWPDWRLFFWRRRRFGAKVLWILQIEPF